MNTLDKKYQQLLSKKKIEPEQVQYLNSDIKSDIK